MRGLCAPPLTLWGPFSSNFLVGANCGTLELEYFETLFRNIYFGNIGRSTFLNPIVNLNSISFIPKKRKRKEQHYFSSNSWQNHTIEVLGTKEELYIFFSILFTIGFICIKLNSPSSLCEQCESRASLPKSGEMNSRLKILQRASRCSSSDVGDFSWLQFYSN